MAVADHPASEDLTHLSIEELMRLDVIKTSRLGQKTSKTPATVTVLTAAEIRTFGWRTLADALNAVRGLYTSNNRNYSFVGVRGFLRPGDYNSRILIMIDGLRMNENVYDTGNIAQEFMLDMDLIERIEFVPGSGATVYGANAFFGLVNVVTKPGAAVHGGQLAGEIGTFNAHRGRATFGKQFENGTDVLVSASHYASEGVENLYFPVYDNPATNNGIAHNKDNESNDRLFAKVGYNGLTFSAGFVKESLNKSPIPS